MDENQISLRLVKSPLKLDCSDQRLPFKNISNYDSIHKNNVNEHLDQATNKVLFGKFDTSLESIEDTWKERTEVITKETHQNYLSYSREVVNEIIIKAMNNNHSLNNGMDICKSGNDEDFKIKPNTKNKLDIKQSDNLGENFLLSEPALELLKSFENMGISTPTTRKISKERAQYIGESRSFNPFVKSCSATDQTMLNNDLNCHNVINESSNFLNGMLDEDGSSGLISVELSKNLKNDILLESILHNPSDSPITNSDSSFTKSDNQKSPCKSVVENNHTENQLFENSVFHDSSTNRDFGSNKQFTVVGNLNDSIIDSIDTNSTIISPNKCRNDCKNVNSMSRDQLGYSNSDKYVSTTSYVIQKSPNKSDSTSNNFEVTLVENMNGSACDSFVSKTTIKNSPCNAEVDSFKISSTVINGMSTTLNLPYKSYGTCKPNEEEAFAKNLDALIIDPNVIKHTIQSSLYKSDVENMEQNSIATEILSNSNIDPFITRSAVQNSPDKHDTHLNQIEVAFIENKNDSICDPFVTKSIVNNSPCKPDVDLEKMDSTVVISKSAAHNLSYSFDVEQKEQETLNKTLDESTIQNLPSETGFETTKVDFFGAENLIESNIDPFITRSAVHNSPNKYDASPSSNQLEVTFIENKNDSICDPFISKSEGNSSPCKSDVDSEKMNSGVVISKSAAHNLSYSFDVEQKEQETLNKTLDESTIQNLPSETGFETTKIYFFGSENLIESKIDPFVTSSAVYNSPNKHDACPNQIEDDSNLNQIEVAFIGNKNDSICDPFVTKSIVNNSPFKPDVDLEKMDSTVVISKSAAHNFSYNSEVEQKEQETLNKTLDESTIQNLPSETGFETTKVDFFGAENLIDSNIDPFVTRSAVYNSPNKHDACPNQIEHDSNLNQIEVAFIENKNDSICDPFVTKSIVNNSPCKPDVDLEKMDSTVVISKSAAHNFSYNSDVEQKEQETLNKTLDKSTIQNLPSESGFETTKVDFFGAENLIESNIDPFITRSAVHNSPNKYDASSNQIEVTFIENKNDSICDPFISKSEVNSSPCKSDVDSEKINSAVVISNSAGNNLSYSSEVQQKEQVTLNKTLDKSTIQNLPSETGFETTKVDFFGAENLRDSNIDPFVTKSTVNNSPCKFDVDSDKKLDSTVVISKLTSLNLSYNSDVEPKNNFDVEIKNPEALDMYDSVCDPFVTKSTINSSLCKSEVDSENLDSTVVISKHRPTMQNFSYNLGVESKEQETLDKILNESYTGSDQIASSIQNLPHEPGFETTKVDFIDRAENLRDPIIDPFITRSAVHNSPNKYDGSSNQLEVTFIENKNDSICDPFISKSEVNSSPCKSDVDSEKINSAVVISNSAVNNLSYSSDVEQKEQETLNKTLDKSIIQNLPSETGFETTKVDFFGAENLIESKIDPFVTRSAVYNSPNKHDACPNQIEHDSNLNQIEVAFIENKNDSICDPFVTKSIVNNSPCKPDVDLEKMDSTVVISKSAAHNLSYNSDVKQKKQETLNETLDESTIQNLPSETGFETTKGDFFGAENLIESNIDPFVTRSAVYNSPNKHDDCPNQIEVAIIENKNDFTTASSIQSSIPNMEKFDNIEVTLAKKFGDICIDQFIDEGNFNSSPQESKVDPNIFDSTFVENCNTIKATSIIQGSQSLSEERDSTLNAGIGSKPLSTGSIVQSSGKINELKDLEFTDSTDFESYLQIAEKDIFLDNVGLCVSNVRQSISSIEFDKIAIKAVELASVASQNIPECLVSDDLVDSEEFSDANDFFCNNEELDELSAHGIEGDKKNLIRNSLFVKFDPLVAGRKSLAPFLEKERKDVLDPRRESSLIFFSPAKKMPILSSTMNITALLNENADQTLVKIDDSSVFEASPFDNTTILNESSNTSMLTMLYRSKSNVETSFSSIEVQTENEVVPIQDHQAALRNLELAHQGVLLRKSQEFEKMQKNLKDEIKCKIISNASLTEENTKMKKTSHQLLSLLQQIKDKKEKMESEYVEQIKLLIANHTEEVDKHKKEILQKQDELQQSETSLFDFFKKYERMRQVVETLHRNAELMKKENVELKKEIDEKTSIFKEDYTKIEDKLKEVILKFEEEEKVHLHEKNKAALLFKRAEMKILSLTEDVAKKQDEIKHLTDLLDEFGQKFS